MSGLNCPDGTVPGWLDESGLPTSCVGDLPLVEPLPERTADPNQHELIPPIDICASECASPAPAPSPSVLADTGDALSALIAGIALTVIALGLALVAHARTNRKPRYRRH